VELSPAAHRLSRTFALPAQGGDALVDESPRWFRKGAAAIFLLGIGLLVAGEMKFSWLESRFFAAEASRVNYKLASGPSERIRYPDAGPYDLQRGYSILPVFFDRLRGEDYSIEEQARDSGWSLLLARQGVYPIYHEKNQAGLDIVDSRGATVYSFRDPQRTYSDFASIPPLVVRTLLFIENRHLLDESEPDRNPAIEWGRLAHAALDFGLHKVDRHHSVTGGSTLATQLEKLRHSPEGRTHSPAEKFRQIASATLRSYQDGPRTLNAQRVVIRDYINSIPLSATLGHGEVTGLGDGLATWYGADFGKVNQLLSADENGLNAQQMDERARAYRQVLSLFLALREPSTYLARDPDALASETDRYLGALCEGGVISSRLRDAALQERISLKPGAPVPQPDNFVASKATNAVRAQLLGLLGLDRKSVV
jgi:membrane peptidoglycan carboxypeptidase